MLKGSKAAEHGTEYADDDENNQDAASEDKEPKGEFTFLPKESTTKERVEPKQDDAANTKSGCSMPEDIDRHMSEGRPIFFIL